MYYDLLTDLIHLVKQFEDESASAEGDVRSFLQWVVSKSEVNQTWHPEPEWLGKENGRSPESVINTSLVHLSRYAKLLAKQAITGSSFSTPDEFIYLICLISQGSMTKSALIKLNVHEKSAGIQIINRLIHNGWVEQLAGEADKRNRMIHITETGREILKGRMDNIREASRQVTEPLSHAEKMNLINLLMKLESFHEAKLR